MHADKRTRNQGERNRRHEENQENLLPCIIILFYHTEKGRSNRRAGPPLNFYSTTTPTTPSEILLAVGVADPRSGTSFKQAITTFLKGQLLKRGVVDYVRTVLIRKRAPFSS
jgi:hypothetical protein